jgi:hypothetical protein
MLATNNEGQQQRIADDSVITQYGVPGGGGRGLRQSQRQSSWSSLLCCVRPSGEECVRLACPKKFRLSPLMNQCTAALPCQRPRRGHNKRTVHASSGHRGQFLRLTWDEAGWQIRAVLAFDSVITWVP